MKFYITIERMKRIFAALVLVLLTFAYLYPGSAAMVVGSTSEVMSDNTDISPAPFNFENIVRVFHENPNRFLFGAIYIDRLDPDQGVAAWVSLSERWLVLGLYQIMPSEQISTALVFIYLLLNGFAMFALSRALGWRNTIGYGLALAWTFSFYALARAQVHTDFTALYHLPLIFLSLLLVARAKSLLALSLPAFLFLLAGTVPYYYLLTAAFISPLLLGFFFLQPETRGRRLRAFARLVMTAIPLVCVLAFNFVYPIPNEVRAKMVNIMPETGVAPQGMNFHPFLSYYAARPIDYFTGPIWPGSYDPNPWRAKMNLEIQGQVAGDGRSGNTHERTNGIRWLVWLLASSALMSVLATAFFRKLSAEEKVSTRLILYFVVLALAGFALSLGPPPLHPHFSPAYWLHALVSQVRVPSRAGMYVAFSLLMIVGYWLSSTLAPRTLRKVIYLPALFPFLILAEFPPFSRVQMAPMRAQIEALTMSHGGCGAGMYFPFVSNLEGVLDFYYFQQRMRGTNCQILNAMTRPEHISWLTSRFPPNGNYVKQLPGDGASRVELLRVARCVPLSWIVFDPHVPAPWLESVCQELGWQLNSDLSCVAPDHSVPLQRFPDDCG